MKHKNIIYIIEALFLFFAFIGGLSAQEESLTTTGVVKNEFGKPLPEVVVSTDREENQTTTNEEGAYSILVNDGSKQLVFSYLGYSDKKVEIGTESLKNVVLQFDPYQLDEKIDLGYSIQRKKDISGSISTVTGEELLRSPVNNISQSLAGRLPGLYTKETYSEPSRATTSLYVRGINNSHGNEATVVVDGIVVGYKPSQTLDYITAAEIESISVLKDAASQALYGIQGGNGIIVIKTKRGTPGDLRVNVRLDASVQEVTTTPVFINSAEYAQLRNEAAYNDGFGKNYYYSVEQIEKYRSGEDPNLYPNTNWYDLFFKKQALTQRAGVDVTGGSDKVTYFSNINILHQGSQFKTDQEDYNSSPNFFWANFRSNMDVKLNSYLSSYLNLSGNIKRERVPGGGTFGGDLYSSLFNMPSSVYGPVTPQVTDPVTGEITDEGGAVITTDKVGNPTYGTLNRSGYTNHTVTNIYAQFGLKLDLSFLTKGLDASGIIGYQTNSVNSTTTTQSYERWMKTTDPEDFSFIKKGSETNTPLSYGKGSSFYYHLTYKGMINYKRNFDKHHIGAMAYFFYQDLIKSDTGSPANLPYDRVGSGFEATYDYDNRYLLKFDVGYSGSEQYARGSRYLATPAVSAAWIPSNESFFKEIGWLSLLKLRASIGKTGNDQSDLNRFSYLDNITVSGGGNIGSLQWTTNESQKANPYISAEVIKKQNYGIDFGIFNSLNLSVDVFKERMDNMIVNPASIIPSYQGIPLNYYPSTNSGSFENKGYEIELNYEKEVDKDWTIRLGGFFSDAKNKQINTYEAEKGEEYVYRHWNDGFPAGQVFGYLVDYSNGNGFFNFQGEIDHSGLTYAMGTPRVGDLKYKDLNGDGRIGEEDKAPLGTGTVPRQYYGISGGFSYKSFDVNFLLQGVGKWESVFTGTGVWENQLDGIYGSLHRNAWTEERFANGDKITSPALSLSKSVNHEWSDYYLYDRSYLRFKNLEIAYTLPLKVSKRIAASRIKIILSGQNLLTWDHMKSDDFGPEGSYTSLPVYRVYNLGVNIQF